MAHTAAMVSLLVLASIVASSTTWGKPECCRDYHKLGNALDNTTGCPQSDKDCNEWCKQAACSRDGPNKNGFCKKIGKLHYCHCKC